MIPRFDAKAFTGITPEMTIAFDRDGVLVLENLIPAAECDKLMARMNGMVAAYEPEEQKSIFSSVSEAHAQLEYFLNSGHQTHFFFEEEAFDPEGNLTKPKELALNKVGHAMHDLDPVFDKFCRQPAFESIAKGLGLISPLLLQTMYIFKQPHIGGEVVCHQDSVYLRTEPHTCLGLWVALEDATTENGCLWGIPGGHKVDGPKAIFRRDPETNATWTEMLNDAPYDEGAKTALPAPKGTVLVFGGLFPHMSDANRSDKSRHAFTLHLVDKEAHYPADNWLLRPDNMPLRGF